MPPRIDPWGERTPYASGEAWPTRVDLQLGGNLTEDDIGLLRDLHDLYLMACECDMAWTLVGQAAHGLRDRDLLEVVQTSEEKTSLVVAE